MAEPLDLDAIRKRAEFTPIAGEVRALVAEVEQLRSRCRLLEQEITAAYKALASPGPMPHRCLNPECGTIKYGTGYEACPSCGGTDGRALASPAAASEEAPIDN